MTSPYSSPVPNTAASEARILMRYILGSEPPLPLIERYVQAVAKDIRRLDLPPLVRRFPRLVRCLEAPIKPRTTGQHLLRGRLDLALALCEVSAHGKELLWRAEDESRAIVIARLIASICLDVLSLPVRVLLPLVWTMRDGR